MTIQKILLLTIFLSTSAFAADLKLEKSPSELKWSSDEGNCMGKVCVKVNDKPLTPNLLEKMDKFEQQDLKEPPAFRKNDSDQKTLHFSFGDDQ